VVVCVIARCVPVSPSAKVDRRAEEAKAPGLDREIGQEVQIDASSSRVAGLTETVRPMRR
jgi:hypothetical protein